MSWGSRPTIQSAAFQAVEKAKMLLYKNYRSKFLLFWITLNLITAVTFIVLFEEGHTQVIFYIGTFLVLTILFRIVLSILHMVKAKCEKIRTNFIVYRRKSTVFEKVGEFVVKDKREVFGVYYDERDQEMLFAKRTDPVYKTAFIKSSVKDPNVYRGFSLQEITYKHRLSQGLFEGRISRTSGIQIPRQSSLRYINESVQESEVDDSSSVEDPVLSPKETLDRFNSHIIGDKKLYRTKKLNFTSVKDK